MTTTTHPDNECSLPDCFCHVAQRLERERSTPVTKTAFGFHLDTCGVCASVAEQFPDLELFDHQLCLQGRQLFRNPSQPVVTAPAFTTEEWESAPRWATRTTEVESAEYWFLRGVRAGETAATIAINSDLKELRRVAAERIEQR